MAAHGHGLATVKAVSQNAQDAPGRGQRQLSRRHLSKDCRWLSRVDGCDDVQSPPSKPVRISSLTNTKREDLPPPLTESHEASSSRMNGSTEAQQGRSGRFARYECAAIYFLHCVEIAFAFRTFNFRRNVGIASTFAVDTAQPGSSRGLSPDVREAAARAKPDRHDFHAPRACSYIPLDFSSASLRFDVCLLLRVTSHGKR